MIDKRELRERLEDVLDEAYDSGLDPDSIEEISKKTVEDVLEDIALEEKLNLDE